MFTGIIETVGKVALLQKNVDGARLHIDALFDEKPKLGDSIAINGACMTVCAYAGSNILCFDVSLESLSRTNLNFLQVGDLVNLERSLKANGRIDGHFVTGHVDRIGTLNRIEIHHKDRLFYFGFPAELNSAIVSKGSIAINGISLTVIEPQNYEFHVTIVPFTYEHTNLKDLSVGSRVNLETDILAKYVQNVALQKQENSLTKDFLAKAGF